MLLQTVSSAQNGVGAPYGSSVVTSMTGVLRKDGNHVMPSRNLIPHVNSGSERLLKTKPATRWPAQEGFVKKSLVSQPARTQHSNGYAVINSYGQVKNVKSTKNTKREVYKPMEIKLIKPIYVDVKLDRNRNYRKLDQSRVLLSR